MSSSLAAPYFILLAQQSSVDSSIKSLSLFIVVSGIASFISSFVWGRFADKSSRQVLLITSILTSALCLATAALNWLQIEISVAGPLALFFLLSVTHQGVRLGRKTYVIDIADGNQRTQYVATSNSVIGALLLVIGLLGALASQLSISLVLLMFAGMALTALCLGMSLPEVSSRRSSDEN
jgi:predicted MFS family arabinose efflux permease